MTIIEFLQARIAEDEAAALATAAPGRPLESVRYFAWLVSRHGIGNGAGNVVAYEVPNQADRDHIARHDPARVLAECEAKRRIVARHTPTDYEGPAPDFEDRQACRICRDEYQDEPLWPCLDLRDMASVYADHPDYRQEWA